MANTAKQLSRTAASLTTATLYTVPASTTTIVTSIAVANTAAASATFDLSLNSVQLFNDVTVAANTTAIIDLKQVLNATQTITGLASAITVNFHIAGVEIV
jgi:hypothetical protein